MAEYIMQIEVGNAPITIQKLIRCKECKHSKEYKDGGIWCERMTGVFKVDHDGFCKWAKRRTDENNNQI